MNQTDREIREKELGEAAAWLKEHGISAEVNQVTIRLGITRPSEVGRQPDGKTFSSNRADIELAATVIIDVTDPDSRVKLGKVVDALHSEARHNLTDLITMMR